MDIADVAKRSGVPASTLRFYEEKGLIASLGSPGERRRFAPQILDQLALISLGQSAGFTLEEIGELLSLSDQRGDDMARVRHTAVDKLTDIEQRIAELQRMHGALKVLVDACPGHGDVVHCPILTALTGARR